MSTTTKIDHYEVMYSANQFPPRIWMYGGGGGKALGQLIFMPDGAAVFLSGIMGGLEHAPLPDAWRGVARMTFPYELPTRRATLLNYPIGWFKIHNLPILDERTQVNTYIACSIMVDTFGQMLDNFVRDYLVERLEASLDSRLVVGYYSRLGLAPGQRFASKGGYLVRFAGPAGTTIAAASDWMVP